MNRSFATSNFSKAIAGLQRSVCLKFVLRGVVVLSLALGQRCLANPILPTIPPGTYTVAAATGNATTDTADVMAEINAARNSSAGGGTVVVPAGTYVCNQLTLYNNIDLQLSTGATIQDASPGSTLITNAGTHDMAITGSGTIDGHATTTSSSNLVLITGASNLLVSGVTVANSSHEHLVLEADNNVTVSNVNINDNYTIAQTGGYLSNTDGLDYSGSHFLIQGCNINDGDDDICAKPGSTYCSDITVANCTIGAGHGISVGGQTEANLSGMTVSGCTLNGTTNGLRLKAGKGQGGIVSDVSFSSITMTNVATPIIINSWYQTGDKYGSAQLSPNQMYHLTNPGETVVTVNQENNTAHYPFFDNISFTGITATGASQNVAIIYGLDSQPANAGDPPRNIDSISFSNVSLSGSYGADIYYVSNLDTSGLKVTASGGNDYNFFGNSSGGTWNTSGGTGSWASGGNWLPATIPTSGTETFAGAPSAPIAVTLDGNRSAGALVFDVSGTSGYSISQGSTSGTALSLGTSAGASIAVISGTHSISAPVVLAGNLVVAETGAAVLDLAGNVSQAAGVQAGLTLRGNGNLVLSGANDYLGGTIVAGGRLILADNEALAEGTTLLVGSAALFTPLALSSQVHATITPAPVPEPSTLVLLATCLFLIVRRRQCSKVERKLGRTVRDGRSRLSCYASNL